MITSNLELHACPEREKRKNAFYIIGESI